ncbi:hypothetical protein E4U37_006569 [Claviceps purpurea]|nr:hypothetical protein E4U37_006569 [Claviceps purpurea]
MPEITSLRFEVLAGQHRIAALREYVSDTESDPAELWWTCELYDQDRLPIRLNQMMRLKKRTDPKTPDSHAQVWLQLVNVTSPPRDEELGDSDAEQMAPNGS